MLKRDILEVHNIMLKIKSKTPWWCFTRRLESNFFVKELRKERDAYRKKYGMDD